MPYKMTLIEYTCPKCGGGVMDFTILTDTDFVCKAVNNHEPLVKLVEAILDDGHKSRFSLLKWKITAKQVLANIKDGNDES